MAVILDTNCLLMLVRSKDKSKTMSFLNPDNSFVYISFASIAEINAIAYANSWSEKKVMYLNFIVDSFQVIEISDFLMASFVRIYAFSQRKSPEIFDYSFSTPRNMGKHDLWIAATASLLNLKLITTDNDFAHLEGHFLTVRIIPMTILQEIVKS
jgi:predicted nucleic acid-binding protein